MSTYDSDYQIQPSDLAQFHRLLAMDSAARLKALLDEGYQYQALVATDSSLLTVLANDTATTSMADLTMYCQRIQLASAKFRSLLNVMVAVRSSLHSEHTRYRDDPYHQLWEMALTEVRPCQGVIEGYAKVIPMLLARDASSSPKGTYTMLVKDCESLARAARQLKECISYVENIRLASHDSSLG